MANFNLNKVILGGRITADIELKGTPAGVSVCQFTIAINRRGSKDGATDFIDCVAWRQTAEFIAKYFSKGSSISIVGELQKRSYKAKDGTTRYITEVNATEAYFVDSKSDAGQAGQTPTYSNTATAPSFEDMKPDEDLPF
jgi:single-strand DNA-binding protein